MLRLRWAVVLCAAAVPLMGSAQSARVIAGTVYDDRAALAVRANFVPAAGVTVKLYRDGGDGLPSADDAIVDTDTTDGSGNYVFRQTQSGDYWVAVDSRTIKPVAAWAEQTFGPAGSLCVRQDGITQASYFEGSCIGGRTTAVDDASSLATSEHVALVTSSDAGTGIDFAFSFNVVTSSADGDRVQGTLRQFIANANAVGGPSRMRFVPITPAPEQRHPTMGVPLRWWTIALTAPLPELRDDDTVIDGTAYNLLSPASVVNVHPGRLGEMPTIRPQDRTVPLIEKPELELTVSGENGIVCATRCGIRSLALHGPANDIITRGDARIEHVMIGATPDGVPANAGSVGLQVEKGVAFVRHLLVSTKTRAGVLIGTEAKLDAERMEINRCGDPLSGGAIVLLSDKSTIRHSVISANPGAGIIIGSLDGATPAHANTIDNSTISSNQAGVLFGPGSSRNVITRNDIMWNRIGGVTSAPFETTAKATPPRENRVSANRFDENGLRPIILDLSVDDPNALARSAGSCQPIAGAANNGISPPRLTDVRIQVQETTARVTVRGQACPGQTVELYQSFVTSGIRDNTPDVPRIRSDKIESETISTDIANDQRATVVPSIGEFNYLGATSTAADGSFEASFPLRVVNPTDTPPSEEKTDIWASDVLLGSGTIDRGLSAIAIDAAGNTSEMSVRRQVD
ncbi:MAG TPA: right-handed parallel beta-helix repeat-containing protein [Thermoanaerobaculia bacterium]|nr:right-handed parallel beta-helix repeat-containing protein [Thermoanaerobaculia bacterium]